MRNRYHKNVSNEIYLYSFDEYDKENKQLIFLCKYEGCTGKAYYNLNSKKFSIAVHICFVTNYIIIIYINKLILIKKYNRFLMHFLKLLIYNLY